MDARSHVVIPTWKRACACSLVALLGVMQPIAATAADVTILVNGSYDDDPTWIYPGSPEFGAIADTFGYPPTPFQWFGNDNVIPPLYSSIWNGAMDLANFLNGVQADNVNVIAHSHGGNVVKIASWWVSRPLGHVINLATPVNWDLWPLDGHAYSFCQASSYWDWVQFFGASPTQVSWFFENQYRAARYAWEAAEAALNGDWDLFAYYSALAAYHEAEAQLWWLSTKIEPGAANHLFGGVGHGDMHEPPVWNAIKNQCALN